MCAAAAILRRRRQKLGPACIHYMHFRARLLLHMEIKDPDSGLVKQLRFAFLGFTVSSYSVARIQNAAVAACRLVYA